jgi:hypothetical protein
MGFQTSRSSNNSNSTVRSNSVVEKKKSDSIKISGLYEGTEGTKLALRGSSLKEAITIPAGYEIRVFTKGGTSKNGKELPPYELVAQPAMKKDKQ